MAESEVKREVPEGLSCYIVRLFGESIICPDLDEEVPRSPKCRKYDVKLGWTVSGRILKCLRCLKSGVQSG